jgi:hypothetical protein|eukprot:4532302-Prymnesium_polylepis.1
MTACVVACGTRDLKRQRRARRSSYPRARVVRCWPSRGAVYPALRYDAISQACAAGQRDRYAPKELDEVYAPSAYR